MKNWIIIVCIDLLDPKTLHEKVLGILAFLTMPATFLERILLLDKKCHYFATQVVIEPLRDAECSFSFPKGMKVMV